MTIPEIKEYQRVKKLARLYGLLALSLFILLVITFNHFVKLAEIIIKI